MKKSKLGEMKSVQVVTSEEELAKVAETTPGPIVLEFVADWCDSCKAEQPEIEKLAAAGCVTVVQVDVDKAPALADKWKVEGMPTLFSAKTGSALTPESAKELSSAAAAFKKFKCSR